MTRARQPDSSELLELACAAHGGLDTWLNVHAFHGSCRHLGGAIPLFKGLGTTFDAPGAFSVYPHERRTVFHDYPKAHCKLTFDTATSPARILVSSPFDQQTVLPRYRDRFLGLAKWRRWTPTDAAYFFGYALLTYFSVPFILTDCDVLRCNRNAITVRFPLEIESHCQVQTFWFAANGTLTRHDYTADILGSVFRGAHYSSDYVDVQGVKLAQTRRVVPRVAIVPLPLTVLSAALSFN